jgi:hypothetical protein
MKRNLTGYQFGIYWTRLNVNKALSSSNGNVCITLSFQNRIDILAWLVYVFLSGYSSVSALLEQWFYYYDF